uniref:FBA_2 domain-containing protein n=1 Tax=Caenorhabditis tropicalis TaxID=1561998 RepID=A0A1I7ULT0_9PELO
MDSELILTYKVDWPADDLNVFLRSWQEGKTNRRLRQVNFVMCSERNVKEVLKGLGGELMDPRTTKLKIREDSLYGYEDKWICGGIHIRRNDERLAVINGYKHSEEDENADERDIQEYLNEREMWNSEESSWLKEAFVVYIFPPSSSLKED